MQKWNTRTALLIGKEQAEKLEKSHVLIVVLGGVGAYAAELLCRAGIGRMTLVDADVIQESNLNRQLPALHSTMGKAKADVVAARLQDINPEIAIEVRQEFIRDELIEQLLDAAQYDFVVDAIDSISPKAFLLYHAYQRSIPIISSMGAGAKMDPSAVKIADLSKSTTCALARVIRKRLKGLGVTQGIPVVFSTELPLKEAVIEIDNEACKRSTTGTISYMPSIFGCFLASHVIKHLGGSLRNS